MVFDVGIKILYLRVKLQKGVDEDGEYYDE
jgi:hypothetical protein